MAVAPMEWRQIFLTIIIVVETSEEEGLFAIVYKHMLILLLLKCRRTVETPLFFFNVNFIVR